MTVTAITRVFVYVAYEMLMLNGHVRYNAVFMTKPTFDSKFQFDCIKKKKLNASNVAFLTIFGIRGAKYLKITDILNIELIFDDHIVVKIETHTYNPFANTTFGYSDEIRVPIQQQDLYTLPYQSFPYIEGKLMINKPVAGSDVTLGNNCVAFMFDEIRYELDGMEIDRNRNVGITSTLKNYVTMLSEKSVIARNAWLGSMKSSKWIL